MNPHLGIADYFIVAIYLLAMVWIGVHFSKKQRSADHYFAGDRRIPAWAVGMSLLATIISSVTFIAYPGTGFSSNWNLLVQGLMVPVVLLAGIWFIVPIYRRSIRISAYEYFEKRFSYGSRLYASLAFSVIQSTKLGTVVYLLARALTTMAGWDTSHTGRALYIVIVCISLATIFYTLVGGIEAVV